MTYISMSLFWWKIWNLYIVYNPHNYVYIPTLTLSVSPRPHISVPTICFKYYSVLYHRDYFSIPLLLICNCFSDGEEPDSICGCVYYYCACLVVSKLLTQTLVRSRFFVFSQLPGKAHSAEVGEALHFPHIPLILSCFPFVPELPFHLGTPWHPASFFLVCVRLLLSLSCTFLWVLGKKICSHVPPTTLPDGPDALGCVESYSPHSQALVATDALSVPVVSVFWHLL